MYDIECPYCGKAQSINHDDGYGFEENEIFQQKCECGKIFTFTTSIDYYEAKKAPCQNGEPHKMKQIWRVQRVINGYEEYRCIFCGYREDRKAECFDNCKQDKINCWRCAINE